MTDRNEALITRARLLPGLGPDTGGLVDVTVLDDLVTDISPSQGRAGDIDADGALLLPGLWDHHAHFSTHALIQDCLDLSATRTPSDVADVLRDHLHGARDDEVVLGFGHRSGGWVEAPTAVFLDEVSPLPIALIAGDMHSVWANTAGLVAAGFGGRPSGFLLEDDAFDAISHLMGSQAALLDRAVERAARAAAAKGVVGIVDMEMRWAVGAWARRAAHAPLPLHVEAATYPADLDRLIADGLRTGQPLGNRLVVGPLKLIFDGSMSTKTALCSTPYAHPLPHMPHGRANFTSAEMTELLARATAHGIEVAVHAIGDEGCRVVLDAFAATGAVGTVEHAQFVLPADVARFRTLGVAASVQPSHLAADQYLVDQIWPQAGGDLYPLRSFVDAGAELRFGSDAPVAPLDPWVSLDVAVNRTHHREQRLTPLEALSASTRGPVAVGAVADLVLVPTSAAAVLAGDFGVDEVLMTMVSGEITHSPR